MTIIDRSKWLEQPTSEQLEALGEALWDLLTYHGDEVHLWHNEEGDLVSGVLTIEPYGVKVESWSTCEETYENVLNSLAPGTWPCEPSDSEVAAARRTLYGNKVVHRWCFDESTACGLADAEFLTLDDRLVTCRECKS